MLKCHGRPLVPDRVPNICLQIKMMDCACPVEFVTIQLGWACLAIAFSDGGSAAQFDFTQNSFELKWVKMGGRASPIFGV